MNEIERLIDQKMTETIAMNEARDGMEQAKQAYEHHQRRVEYLTQEIARVAIGDNNGEG